MDHAGDLRKLLNADPKRLHILSLVRSLQLPDCWVAAGLLRNAVWDQLHNRPCSDLSSDVDVIWFDLSVQDPSIDRNLESKLKALDPSIGWSVKNQSRMHVRNSNSPYASAIDAMRYWPETATAVAVREVGHAQIEVEAPFGLEDLYELVVRPTPRFHSVKLPIFMERIRKKRWLEIWPRLRVEER